ncbi:MAG: AraC family transcriptional regulator [Eubacteriales bacterium]|nr:AraC family transcriptional regulator [Eubacteriales bacterium]
MLKWIEERLSHPLTVDEISGQVNICPRECQRIFSRYLHYTPMQYVQRRCILAAAEMLSSTDDPVTDIALACGFSSPSYFSKQFKALIGSSPTEYRVSAQLPPRH